MGVVHQEARLRITLPDGIEIAAVGAAPGAGPTTGPAIRGASRGRTPALVPLPSSGGAPPPLATGTGASEAALVAAALGEQELELVSSLALQSQPTRARGLRGPAAQPEEVLVELEVDANEGAVVLLEQDGLYQWSFPTEEEPLAAPAPGRRAVQPSTRRVKFRVPVDADFQAQKKRGWLTDFVLERAQLLVFKFAGRFLLKQGVKFLERKVRTGLVDMSRGSLTEWTDRADFAALSLPTERPARVLLFVHGTFSSTRGGFAGLDATSWGRAFLTAARANYDAVVGFDHPTLSVDPRDNATALLCCLEAREWSQPVSIDVITHSRGGITLRSLTEGLLREAKLPVSIERVIHVAATNGGTELANPKNWVALINLYTNLAAAGCRAVASFPHAAPLSLLLAELLKGVGVLAKVLVEEGLTHAAVPGLAAMQPEGPFIQELNRTQPGQPTPLNSRYYAITSDFKANLALEHGSELPGKLLLALADAGADQLMKVANDLVVHVASMTCIDPDFGTFIKDTLAFAPNGQVYHTNYFLQPAVVKALTRWLEMEDPVRASPARVRGAVVPGTAKIELPAAIQDDLLVLPADVPVQQARRQLATRPYDYVVVQRDDTEDVYAFRFEELSAALGAAPEGPLSDALQLSKVDAAPLESYAEAVFSTPAPGAKRMVVAEHGAVLGVVEARVEPRSTAELVEQEQRVAAQRVAAPPRRPDQGALERSPRTTRGTHRSPPAAVGYMDSLESLRGGPTPAAPAAGAPVAEAVAELPADQVKCHVAAEMDDSVLVNELTSVDVYVSQQVLFTSRSAVAFGELAAKPDHPLIVELIAKKNFVVGGQARVQLSIPAANAVPAQCVFDVRATDVGDGEVLVRFRQGNLPLTSVTLRCKIVAKRERPAQRRPAEVAVLDQDLGPEPRHTLTITEVERGGAWLYEFRFESESLGIIHRSESKPMRGAREAFINGVYADLEERYLAVQSDFDQFQQEIREIGGTLWDELIPKELQEQLWKSRDAIDSIQILSEEPFIPWELVHLKEPGKGLPSETRFLGQMGMVRWQYNIGWPTRALWARAKRCFFVIPNYPHPQYVLPQAQLEADFLTDAFAATPVEPHAAPLRALLEKPGVFDLLHFACHGVAESHDIGRAELLLQGRIDGGNYVTEKLRAATIEHLDNLVGPDGAHPIVTLNACQAGRAGYKLSSIGGFSRAFLSKGAGMVVAALWSVGDRPARVFTEALYAELRAGKTLAEASRTARERAREGRDATWLAYTVYGNPHATLRTGQT